uniref:xanthine dehydrogenase n=1 Tax=Latimeria chalumnae TaxID=7897 RepID=H3A831_LATCH
RMTGTKYGCGGGGYGACTVMISKYNLLQSKILHFPANACLVPICMLHGAAVTTVEGVGSTKTRVHPVQEQIAKAHSSHCGFCTPGMVMSMYTLLRNHPEPSMDYFLLLLGNLCRCTGYRPIIDGFKTFCKESKCCQNGNQNGSCCCEQEDDQNLEKEQNLSAESFKTDYFLPVDPSQELIFPPELMLLAQKEKNCLVFHGERMTWISPASMEELLELKTRFPKALLVVGSTTVGPNLKFKGILHLLVIAPDRIEELHIIQKSETDKGIILGAACRLALVKDVLTKAVHEFPEEKTQVFQAFLQQLQSLAGQQVRSMVSLGGNIVSGNPKYDLSTVLAAASSILKLVSKGGSREIPLKGESFVSFGKTALNPDEVLVSVNVPYSKEWEYVSAFRQAQRHENSFSIVNSGMRVVLQEGTNIIEDLRIFYGGIGPTIVSAKKTCWEMIGRSWNEEMLSEACRLLSDELPLPGSAPGGMVEYRRALTLSFFKFYLSVLQRINKQDPSDAKIPQKHLSALKPFKKDLPRGFQEYQEVPADQPTEDPIGHPIMHQSAIKQATGEAVYCDDIPSLDGELSLAFVTSTRPHAKIVSIDAAEALTMPGVADFITACDVPGKNRREWFEEEEELFVEKEVTCVGQIIAAVIADTKEHAKRGAAAVKITYEDLELVFFTIQEATKHKSFFSPERKLERGNVDEAFKTSDHILEEIMQGNSSWHWYDFSPNIPFLAKERTVECMNIKKKKKPQHTTEVVAGTLGVDANKITCHVKRLGGSFGGKVMKIASLSSIAALAAQKTGCSVRCVLDRGDDMLITGGRHPFLGKYKVGYKEDGTIVAADITYYSNGGNTLDESIFIMEKALLHMDNGYKIPNLRGRGIVCKTNLPSNTAFRGFGAPQGLMVIESIMYEVAAKCHLPVEKVRDINLYKEVDYTHYKQTFDPYDMVRCWNECLEKSSYRDRKAAIEEFNKQNRWKKRGISVVPLKFGVGFSKGFYNQGAALVHIYKDGSVLVTHGGTEMGQGIHTKVIQVASRELKIPMSWIHVNETCTNTVPNAAPSAASFGTDAVGMAVKDATEKLRKRLEPIIQRNPKCSWEYWASAMYLSYLSLSSPLIFSLMRLKQYRTYFLWEHPVSDITVHRSLYGASNLTNKLFLLHCFTQNIRTDIVMDVGCSLNPALDIGQVEGGFIQGIGLYTIEELKYSPQGVLYSRGPSQYKIPAVCDIPAQMNVSLLADSRNPHAIYSSKGIGEPSVFFGCTVFYAIKDAIAAARKDIGLTGTFTLNSPATAACIRMACQDQFTEMVHSANKGSFTPWAIDVC